MRMRTLLAVNTFLATVHGLAFVLLPATALAFYGVTMGPAERLMGQLFGTGLLTVALMCWFGRGLGDAASQRMIAIALGVPYVVGAIVTLMATLSGVMNVNGWIGVAIYAGLAAAYGWALLARHDPAGAVGR